MTIPRELADQFATVPTNLRQIREYLDLLPELKHEIRELAEGLDQLSEDLSDKLSDLSEKID